LSTTLSCGLPFERIHRKINTETEACRKEISLSLHAIYSPSIFHINEDFATNLPALHSFLACLAFPATLD
jgi:hypothetical protein